jgi:ribosomal protein S12 methylthiotransferase
LDRAPAVAFVTLGCPKNEVDTDRMRAATAASAYSVVTEPAQADVVVINTCAFIQDATEESLSTIFEMASEWLPLGPSRSLVVTGCLPARYGAELAAELPEVAAILPVAEESELLAHIERITGVPACREATGASTRTVEGASAYLRISDGCHRSCAYCTIPSIRGPLVSTPLPELITEAQELVSLGAREVVLIGQDTTSWGRDLSGSDTLADVVRAIAAIPGVDWLRLMYVQPDGVTDDLLSAMAENANVCRYLDIPLQHASKSVLRAMGRRGDGVAFLQLLARIRAAMPDVALRTTVIAGFPGETRADARMLDTFLREARFDCVGVFAYSPEEGTTAALLPDQVPPRTRRARAQRLRDLADDIGLERAASHVGQVLDVLVEGMDEDDDVVVGRWRGQAPEIDGVVLLDKGTAGEIVSARIVDSVGYDLEGEVV